MVFFNSYNIVLNTLRIGYLSKHSYVHMPHNRTIFRFLNKLLELRYIRFYEIMSIKIVRVYLIYTKNLLPNYMYTKLLFRQSFRNYISYRKLFLLLKYDYGTIYLISTTYGLLTHTEAISKRVGGEMICVLYS